MLARCRRCCSPEIAGILLLALACSSALADDDCGCTPEGRGTYVGVFGGGGCSSINDVSQVGTALFPDSRGGPLAVNATGSSGNHGAGLVGLQIGHEWSAGSAGGGWALLPAVEFEGYYLGGTQGADLINPTTRLPEHRFEDSFPMDNAVFLTNVVVSLQTPYQGLTPYVGGGIGTACVSINGADSAQVSPPEPGINHFNSGPDSSCWGFAAQGKVGLRIALTQHAYLFTEYRYLYVSSTTYTFGSTQYPTHVPTTPWTVHFGDMSNHLGVGGIGFSF
jgi:opacity protein-like surface antigen